MKEIFKRLIRVAYVVAYVWLIFIVLVDTRGTQPRQTDDMGRSQVICDNGNLYTETDTNYIKDVLTYRAGISLPIKRDEYYKNICNGGYKLDFYKNHIEGKDRSWIETLSQLGVLFVFFEIVRRLYGYIVYGKNLWKG